uniref:Uncharacterized protein n=1 Tax=Anguilla anguilla TaxID=7936 RepID=A0A0E9PFR6_ANGAN
MSHFKEHARLNLQLRPQLQQVGHGKRPHVSLDDTTVDLQYVQCFSIYNVSANANYSFCTDCTQTRIHTYKQSTPMHMHLSFNVSFLATKYSVLILKMPKNYKTNAVLFVHMH